MTRICVFPGQGVQKTGMGAELFGRYPDLVEQADRILGYSLRALCLENRDNRLDQTECTQPALFAVNALSFLDRQGDHPEPAFAAGHSLGEYNALFAAGAFDFATGLCLVAKRARIMARVRGGAMAAVIGLGDERIRSTLDEHGLGATQLANLNSPRQIVISGPREEILRAEAPLRQAGARYFKVLRVSGAFHTPHAAEAAREFAACLQEFDFRPLRFPVISNVHARPYDETQVRETLSAHISQPVRWTETIRYFLSLDDPDFEEIGPGNVLTGLIRYTRAETRTTGEHRPPTESSYEAQPPASPISLSTP